ncbi:uncharacterized protein mRpS14 isoform X2 [Macrobrachium rosenbergii]|uniref:uncharacterized protein mRpS14 isoform X2 n=2 Tax=Macrobrachium rosenbergii TaxID=79674 RepID=UPI0034D6E855
MIILGRRDRAGNSRSRRNLNMAAPMRSLFTASCFNKLPHTVFSFNQSSICGIHTSSALDKYANWKMVKEVRNRKIVKEFAFERLNINAIRKANKIMPPEIVEMADKEIDALPRDSSISRLHKRCAITSRPRGLVTRVPEVFQNLSVANHALAICFFYSLREIYSSLYKASYEALMKSSTCTEKTEDQFDGSSDVKRST